MRILGSGIDIVSIDRIAASVDRFGERFTARILHENEMQQLSELRVIYPFIAKRFAAKEATAKALGTGIGRELNFTDIEIGHDSLGKPMIYFSEQCQRRLQLFSKQTLLTISDERHYAVAHVLLFSMESCE